MTLPRKRIAIKASASLALLFIATTASAASIGSVTDLDGTLLVSRANGSVRVLVVDSAIEEGDILTSRKQTYAAVTFADNSAVTLGPDTALKIERYEFDKHTADNDGALFALASGSVRITAGLLGTRSGDTFTLATPTATIEMPGASVVAEYVAPDRAELAWRDSAPRDSRQPHMIAASYTTAADSVFVRTVSQSNTLRLAQAFAPPGPGNAGRPPGLYVQVLDGSIHLSNRGGTQNIAAGQFGYTAAFQQPPVVVPSNPGIRFTPPPMFSTPAGLQGMTGGSKSASVDCEVR